MLISKRVEFSASHICRSSQLTDAENERTYGAASNPNGHGHNYEIEVAIEGEPDPVTGMILDLKRLKEILGELGMNGRLSMEKVKAIKEKRDLAKELGKFCLRLLVYPFIM